MKKMKIEICRRTALEKKEKKIDVELLCNTVHYYFMEGPCERNRKWLEQLYTAEGRKLAGFYEENED